MPVKMHDGDLESMPDPYLLAANSTEYSKYAYGVRDEIVAIWWQSCPLAGGTM